MTSRSEPGRFGANISTKFKTLRDIWCAHVDKVYDPRKIC